MEIDLPPVTITPPAHHSYDIRIKTDLISPGDRGGGYKVRFSIVLPMDFTEKSWVRLIFPWGYSGIDLICWGSGGSEQVPCEGEATAPLSVRILSDIAFGTKENAVDFDVFGLNISESTDNDRRFRVEMYEIGSYHQIQVWEGREIPMNQEILSSETAEWEQIHTENGYIVRFMVDGGLVGPGILRATFPQQDIMTVEDCSSDWEGIVMGKCSVLEDHSTILIPVLSTRFYRYPVRLIVLTKTVYKCATSVYYTFTPRTPSRTLQSAPITGVIGLYQAGVAGKRGEAGFLQLTLTCETEPPVIETGGEGGGANLWEIVITLPDNVTIQPEYEVGKVDLSCVFEGEVSKVSACDWNNTTHQITIQTPQLVPMLQCPLSLSISVQTLGLDTHAGFIFPWSDISIPVVQVQTAVRIGNDSGNAIRTEAFLGLDLTPIRFADVSPLVSYLRVSSVVSSIGFEDVLTIELVAVAKLPPGYSIDIELSSLASITPSKLDCFSVNSVQFTSKHITLAEDSVILSILQAKSSLDFGQSLTLIVTGVNYVKKIGAQRTVTVRVYMEKEVIEWDSVSLPALMADFSIKESLIAAEFDFSGSELTVTWPNFDLSIGIWVLLSLSIELLWKDASATSAQPSIDGYLCNGQKIPAYIGLSAAVFVINTTEIGHFDGKLCVKTDKSLLFSVKTEVVMGVIAGDGGVLQYGTVPITTAGRSIAITNITAAPFASEPVLLREKSLFRIDFTTLLPLRLTGGLLVLLEEQGFAEGINCYSLSGEFTQSAVYSSSPNSIFLDGNLYRAMTISAWAETLPAGPKSIQIFATPIRFPVKIQLITTFEGSLLTNMIDKSAVFTYNPESSAVMTGEISDFVRPQGEMRAGGTTDLIFDVKIGEGKGILAGKCSYVKVVVPDYGLRWISAPSPHISSFTLPIDSPLSCFINDAPTSQCLINSNIPLIIHVFIPPTFSQGLKEGYSYSVRITAIGGFQAPSETGYYQFYIGTYICGESASLEEAYPWVHVLPAASFQSLSGVLLCMSAGDPSVLSVSFILTTRLPAATSLIQLSFPYESPAGYGWQSDLGTGLPSHSPIDCLSLTNPSLSPACKLVHGGATTPARVDVWLQGDAEAGNAIELTIAGIGTPLASGYVVGLGLATYWRTDIGENPGYLLLEMGQIDGLGVTVPKSTYLQLEERYLTLSDNRYNEQIDITLNVTAVGDGWSDIWALVKVQWDYPIAKGQLNCVYNQDSVECVGFPIGNWVKIALPGPPSPLNGFITIGKVLSPVYSTEFSLILYLFSGVELKQRVDYRLEHKVALSEMEVGLNYGPGELYEGEIGTFCVKMTMKYGLGKDGLLSIMFPGIYAGRFIVSSCLPGPSSILSLHCSVLDATITATHFSLAIPPSSSIELCIQATHPSSATAISVFQYDSFQDLDMKKHCETRIAIVTLRILPSPQATAAFTTARLLYRLPGQPAAMNDMEPLVVAFTATGPLVPGVSRLSIVISPGVEFDGQKVRCLWAADSFEETADDHCNVIELSDSRARVESVVQVGGESAVFTLTTGGDVKNGLKWPRSGTYKIDLTLNTPPSIPQFSSLYLSVDSISLSSIHISFDHTDAGQPNTFQISFQTGVGIPGWRDGGRITVEIPWLLNDPRSQHSPVSCIGTIAATPSPGLSCYFQRGNDRIGLMPTVVITGFQAISTNTEVEVYLQDIRNPGKEGYITDMTVITLNVSEGWPGTMLEQGRVRHLFVTTPDEKEEYSTGQVGVSSAAVWADTTYNVYLNGNLAVDCFYLYIDPRTTITSLQVNGFTPAEWHYFPLTHTVRLKPFTRTVDHILISGVKNPSCASLNTLKLAMVAISNGRISVYSDQIRQADVLVPYSTDKVTVSHANGSFPLYKNDVVDWRVGVTLTYPIPAGGGVALGIVTSEFVEQTCFNDEDAGSQLLGAYSCAISGRTAIITLNSAQSPPAILSFRIAVKNAASTDHLSVSTLCDSTVPMSEIERFDTKAVEISEKTAPPYHALPLQTHPREYVRASTTGSFEFVVQIYEPFSGYMQVDYPGVRGIAYLGELLCIWRQERGAEGVLPPGSCSAAIITETNTAGYPVTFTIRADTPIPAGKTTITLTTRSSNSPEHQGLLNSVVSGDVDITIRVCYKPGNRCDSATEKLEIIAMHPFRRLEVRYGHRVKGEANYFAFIVVPNMEVTAAGKLVLQFPTSNGVIPLFPTDLGLSSEALLDCEDLGFSCTLVPGQVHPDRPAAIEVRSASGFQSGVGYELSFVGIRNPGIGGDSIQVDIAVFTWDSGKYLEYQIYPDLFAVEDTEMPAAQESDDLPIFIPEATDSYPSFLVVYPSIMSTTDTSIVLVRFDFPVKFGDSVITDKGTPRLYVYSKVMSVVGKSKAVELAFHINPPFQPIGDVVSILHMDAGRILNHFQLMPATGFINSDTSEVTIKPQFDTGIPRTVQSGLAQTMLIEYVVQTPIPASGCILFFFPENSVEIDAVSCRPSSSSSQATINSKCIVEYYQLSLSGFETDLGIGEKIAQLVAIKALSTVYVSAVTYYSSDCATRPITADRLQCVSQPDSEECSQAALLIDSNSMPMEAEMLPLETVREVALAGSKAELIFSLSLKNDLWDDSMIELYASAETEALWKEFYNNPYAELSCTVESVNEKVPAPCYVGSNGHIEIRPSAAIFAGISYTIKITTRGADEAANGLFLPGVNVRQMIGLSTYMRGERLEDGVVFYDVPSAVISKLTITPLHYTAGAYNMFTIEMELSTAVSQSDLIVTEFPTHTADGQYLLFAKDLGTGLKSGAKMPCFLGVTVDCELRQGYVKERMPAQVVITGQAGTFLTYKIMGVNNPIVDMGDVDRVIMHMRVFVENAQGVTYAERTVWNLCTLRNEPVDDSQPIIFQWMSVPIVGDSGTIQVGTSFSSDVRITAVIVHNLSGGTSDPDIASTGLSTCFSGFNVALQVGELSSFIVPIIRFVPDTTTIAVYYIGYTQSDTDERPRLLSYRILALAPILPISLTGQILLRESYYYLWGGTNIIGNVPYWIYCQPWSFQYCLGDWIFFELTVNVSKKIPAGSYWVVELLNVGIGRGNFQSVDPSRFEAILPNFFSTFLWDAANGRFIVPLTIEIAYYMQVKLFLKVPDVATPYPLPMFYSKIYADAGLTNLIAQSDAITLTTGLDFDSYPEFSKPVLLEFLPELRISQQVTRIHVQFELTANFINEDSLTIAIIGPENYMHCNGNYGSPIVTGSWGTASAGFGNEGIQLTGYLWNAGDVIDVQIDNNICSVDQTGLFPAIVYVFSSNKHSNVAHAMVKMFVNAAEPFLTFTMSALVTSPDTPTIYTASLSFSSAISSSSFLALEFPVCESCFSQSLGLERSPGIARQNGDKVAVFSDQLEDCFLQTGVAMQYPMNADYFQVAIICKVKLYVNSVEAKIPFIVIPHQADTLLFRAKVTTSDNILLISSEYLSHQAIQGSVCGEDEFNGASNLLILNPGEPGIPNTIYFNISPVVNAGDVILIVFGTAVSDMSGVSSNTNIVLPNDTYPCPCILVTVTETTSTISISGVTFSQAYQYRSILIYSYTTDGVCRPIKTYRFYMPEGMITIDTVGNRDTTHPVFIAGIGFPTLIAMRSMYGFPQGSTLRISFDGFEGIDISSAYAFSTLAMNTAFSNILQNSFQVVGMSSIAPGILLEIRNLFLYGSCPNEFTTNVNLFFNEVQIASGSYSHNCYDSQNLIPHSMFYIPTVSFYGSARSYYGWAFDFISLRLLIDLPVAMKKNDWIQLQLSGGFYDGYYGGYPGGYPGEGSYYGYFQRGTDIIAALKVNRDSSRLMVYSPTEEMTNMWILWVSANNWVKDGLPCSPSNTLTVTASFSNQLYSTSNFDFDRRYNFLSTRIQPFAHSEDHNLPIEISFIPSMTINSFAPAIVEIVVQFPPAQVYPYNRQFPANPSMYEFSGQQCEVAMLIGGLRVTPDCHFFFGDDSFGIKAFRYPPMFVITGVNLQFRSSVVMLLPLLLNSGFTDSGLAADVILYTRIVTADRGTYADSELVLDYIVVKDVILTTKKPVSNLTQPMLPLSTYQIQATGVTYSFSITAPGATKLLIQFPAAFLTTSFLQELTSETRLPLPIEGCLFIRLETYLGADSTVIDVGGVTNPQYAPENIEETFIRVYASTAAYEMTEILFTFPPSVWVPFSIQFSHSPTLMYWHFQTTHQFSLSIPAVLPPHSTLVISFPMDCQSLRPAVTADIGECKIDGISWLCSFKDELLAGTQITISGKVMSVATTPDTGPFLLTAYTGLDKRWKIAESQGEWMAYSNQIPKVEVLDGFYVPLQREFYQYMVRAGESGPITILFRPGETITYDRGAILVSDVNSAFRMSDSLSPYLICKFTDLSSNIEYRSGGCSYSDKTWSVFPPLSTDLSLSTKWQLTISTTGLEMFLDTVTRNGIPFPETTITVYSLKVTLPDGEEFIDTRDNYPASISEGTLKIPSTATAAKNQSYILACNGPTPFYVHRRISLIFPVRLDSIDVFNPTIGDTSLGGGLDCDTGIVWPAGLSQRPCSVAVTGYTSAAERFVRLSLPITATLNTVLFAGITNPSSSAWLALRIDSGDDPAFAIDSFTRFPYAFLPTVPVPISVHSVAYSLSLTPPTDVRIPVASASPVSLVFVEFPFAIQTATDCSGQMSVFFAGGKGVICESMIAADGFVVTLKVPPEYSPNPSVVRLRAFSGGRQTHESEITVFFPDVDSMRMEVSDMPPDVWTEYDFLVDCPKGLNAGNATVTISFQQGTELASCQAVKVPLDQAVSSDDPITSGHCLCTTEGSIAILYLPLPNLPCPALKIWAKMPPGAINIRVKIASDGGTKVWGTETLTFSAMDSVTFPAVYQGSALEIRSLTERRVIGTMAAGQVVKESLLSSGSTYATLSIQPTLSIQFTAASLIQPPLVFLISPPLITTLSPICTFLSPLGTIHLSPACQVTSSNLSQVISADFHSGDIAGGLWSLWVTDNYDLTGVSLRTDNGRYHIAGDVLSSKGADVWVTNREIQVGLQALGNAAGAPNVLKLTFEGGLSAIPEGIGNNGEILLQFESAVMGATLGSSIVTIADGNNGKVDCAEATTAPSSALLCVLQPGSARSYIHMRGFAQPRLGSSLYIGPIFNPRQAKKCIHVTVTIQLSPWQLIHNSEFRCLIATVSPLIATTYPAIRGAFTSPQTAHITFQVGNSAEAAVLMLKESIPELNGATVTGFSSLVMPVERAILVLGLAGSVIPVSFGSLPRYASDQHWRVWTYAAGRSLEQIDYDNQAYAPGPTISLQAEILTTLGVPSGKDVDCVFRVRLTKPLDPQNQLRIHLPILSSNQSITACVIDGADVSEGVTCLDDSSTFLRVQGLSLPANSSPISLTVSFQLLGQVNLSRLTYIEAIATEDPSTIIETSDMVALTVVGLSASSKLTAKIPPLVSPARSALLGDPTSLRMTIRPMSAFNTVSAIYIQSAPRLTNPEAGIKCKIGTDSVEAMLTTCGWTTNNTLNITVPQGLTLNAGLFYRISVANSIGVAFQLPQLHAFDTNPVTETWWRVSVTDGHHSESVQIQKSISGRGELGEAKAEFGTLCSRRETFVRLIVNPGLDGAVQGNGEKYVLRVASHAIQAVSTDNTLGCEVSARDAKCSIVLSGPGLFSIRLEGGFEAGRRDTIYLLGFATSSPDIPVSFQMYIVQVSNKVAHFPQTALTVQQSPLIVVSLRDCVQANSDSMTVTGINSSATGVDLVLDFPFNNNGAITELFIVIVMSDFEVSIVQACEGPLSCEIAYIESNRWIIAKESGNDLNSDTIVLKNVALPKEPLKGGYPIVVSYSDSSDTFYTHTGYYQSVSQLDLPFSVTWATRLSNASNSKVNRGTYDIWTITIPSSSLSPSVSKLIVVFPASLFQFIDSTYEIHGVTSAQVQIASLTVTVFGLIRISESSEISIQVSALTNGTAGRQDELILSAYRIAGDTMVGSEKSETITISDVKYPFRARIDFVGQSYTFREATPHTNGYLLVRLVPGVTLPHSSGSIEVRLPSEVRPVSDTIQCSVIAKDVGRHQDRNAVCSWDAAKSTVTVTLPNTTLEWGDVAPGTCFWLQISTAIHGDVYGFRAPSVSGHFPVWLTLRESQRELETISAYLHIPAERNSHKIQFLVQKSDFYTGYANKITIFARQRVSFPVTITMSAENSPSGINFRPGSVTFLPNESSKSVSVRVSSKYSVENSPFVVLTFSVSDSEHYYIDSEMVKIRKSIPDRAGNITDWQMQVVNGTHWSICPKADLYGLISWIISPTTGNGSLDPPPVPDSIAAIPAADWPGEQLSLYIAHLQGQSSESLEVYLNDPCEVTWLAYPKWSDTTYSLQGSLDNQVTPHPRPVTTVVFTTQPAPRPELIKVKFSDIVTRITAQTVRNEVAAVLGIPVSRLTWERRKDAMSVGMVLLPSMKLGDDPPSVLCERQNLSSLSLPSISQLTHSYVVRSPPGWFLRPLPTLTTYTSVEIVLRTNSTGTVCCTATTPQVVRNTTYVARQSLLKMDLYFRSAPQSCSEMPSNSIENTTVTIEGLQPETTYLLMCGARDGFTIASPPLLGAVGPLFHTKPIDTNCAEMALPWSSGDLTQSRLKPAIEISVSNAGESGVTLTFNFIPTTSIGNAVIEVALPAGFALLQGRTAKTIQDVPKDEETSIAIHGVTNPRKPGVYGPFGLRTLCAWSAQCMDSNSNFGYVRISKPAKLLDANITMETSGNGKFWLSLYMHSSAEAMWQFEKVTIGVDPQWKVNDGCTATVDNQEEFFALKCVANDAKERQEITIFGLNAAKPPQKVLILTVRIGVFSLSSETYVHQPWTVVCSRLQSLSYSYKASFLPPAGKISNITWASASGSPLVLGLTLYMDLSFSLDSGIPHRGSLLVTGNQEAKQCYVVEPKSGWGDCRTEGSYIVVLDMPAMSRGGKVVIRSLMHIKNDSLEVSIQSYEGELESTPVIDEITNFTALDPPINDYEVASGFSLDIPDAQNRAGNSLSSLDITLSSEDISQANASLHCCFNQMDDPFAIRILNINTTQSDSIQYTLNNDIIDFEVDGRKKVTISGEFSLPRIATSSATAYECWLQLTYNNSVQIGTYQFQVLPAVVTSCELTVFGAEGSSSVLGRLELSPVPTVNLSGSRYVELDAGMTHANFGSDIVSLSVPYGRLDPSLHLASYLKDASAYVYHSAAHSYLLFNESKDGAYYFPIGSVENIGEVTIRSLILTHAAFVTQECHCNATFIRGSNQPSHVLTVTANDNCDSVQISAQNATVWVSFPFPSEWTSLAGTALRAETPQWTSEANYSGAILVFDEDDNLTITGLRFIGEVAKFSALVIIGDTCSEETQELHCGSAVEIKNAESPKVEQASLTLNLPRPLLSRSLIIVTISSDWRTFAPSAVCTTNAVSVLCSLQNNTVMVSIAGSIEKQSFRIDLQGLGEPSTKGQSLFVGGVAVVTLDCAMQTYVVQAVHLMRDVLADNASGFPQHSKSEVYPSVTNALGADMQLQFTFPFRLPSHSVISLSISTVWIWPGDLSPRCHQTFAVSCLSSGTELTLTTSRDLPESTSLSLYLSNVLNTTSSATDVRFQMKASWFGDLLGERGTWMEYLKACADMKSAKVEFTPRKQGVIATYFFVLADVYDFQKDDTITVTFPLAYDGIVPVYQTSEWSGLTCFSHEIEGLECAMERNRLLITLKANGSNEEVLIVVDGLTNPGAGLTGEFQVLHSRKYPDNSTKCSHHTAAGVRASQL